MFDAFYDTIITFIEIGHKALQKVINNQKETLLTVMNILRRAKEKNRIIHTVGMGRSGLVGKFFAELLKLKKIRTSTIGDILAKPVNKEDIVFAFSGSGWTRTTTLYSELSLQRGAILIAFTASEKSKLDRLADHTIYVPGKPILDEMDYVARKIAGKYKTPLAPMGSIPEFSALLISTGIAIAFDDKDDPLTKFKRSIDNILNYAEKSVADIKAQENELEQIFLELEKAKKESNCLFFVGMGLLEYIAYMIAMRFQHLGANVCSMSDWVIRKKDDVLVLLSASGRASIPLLLAKEAKKSGLVILSITCDKESEISRLSNWRINLRPIGERISYFELGVNGNLEYLPSFEIATFIIFEAIIAELAFRLGITEERMRKFHANIE